MAIFSKLGAAIGAAFSVYTVINFAKESIALYRVQLHNEAKLKQALKGREDTVNALIRQANELERITLFEDDDIMNAQALLAINIKDEEQLKKLTDATLDLAQAKGMDLASAAQAVNMATMGQSRALKSLGIELDLTGTKSENVKLVLDALNEVVGGQAVNALGEEEKALHNVNVSIDDFKKSWGAMLLSMSQSLPLDKFSEGMDYISWRLKKYKEEGGTIWTGGLWLERFLHLGDFRVELYKLDQAVASNTEIWKENAKVLGLVTETYADLINHSSESQETLLDVTKLSLDELVKMKEEMVDRYGDLEDEGQKELFDLLNKELKYRQEQADKLKKIQEEKNALLLKELELRHKIFEATSDEFGNIIPWYDALEQVEKDRIELLIQEEKLTGKVTTAVKELDEAYQDEKNVLDDIDTEKVVKELDKIQKKAEEMAKWQADNPFWASLGFESEDQLSAMQDYADAILGVITQIVDQQVEASDRLVDDFNQRIDEQEQAVNRELEFKQEGLANNYEVEQQALADMQKARDQAIKDREKNIQIQKTLSSIESGIALVSAAANIMKGFSEIPVVGVVLGILAVGAMIAAFIAAQSQINSATQFEEGGQVKHGLLKGRRHSQGGIPVEAEDGEWFINRQSSQKYSPLLNAINNDDRNGMKLFFDRQFINKMPQNKVVMKDIDDSKRLGEIVRELRKGKAEVIYGDGFIVEKIGGYTKRINLN